MRHTRSRLVLLAALSAPFLVPAELLAQSLTRRIERQLDQPPLDRHLWGVAVADSTGRLLFSRNAERLFIPASNTKLVVTAAATALLDPNRRVRTSLYGTGPIVDGTLEGHLVLYGRGDPTMSKRCYATDTTQVGACMTDPFTPFRDLVRQLKGRGLRAVAGDIVGDGSWFESTTLHPAWEVGDLDWWYAAPVSGLTFTDNSLALTISATTEGQPADLGLDPDLGTVTIDNRTRTGSAGAPRTWDAAWSPDRRRIIVTGEVPAGSTPATMYLAVADPNLHAAEALRQVLREEGILVRGQTTSTTDSTLHAPARQAPALAEVESRPVRDWIFPILNTSQNLFAEVLLKQIGRAHGTRGSWAEGRRVLRRFLIDSLSIDSTQFAQSDGSGLSASNFVSPAAFVRLLTWIRRHPRYEVFAAGMPRSGLPGSLRRRFVGTPLEGRVVAKTGSINGVNTLSGYVELPRGFRVFSIQANHHVLGGQAMIRAIDSLVVQLGR